ncbi:hypothetical protein SASPL_100923 [Salvia splendens]|uniref:Uncharacterized protein n=1 Tax=Salvia splendens TaxID=180675 RepID=A0A8X8YT22_SALSN|nr:hypothetical protein SASPL_100923 [Salvia splendens]
MGPEGSSAASPAPPSAKRGRDPEDGVYIDNLNSHKRYLSEIMASSLNGLTIGDTLSDNIMDSPVRSDTMMPYLRFHVRMLIVWDETSVQYSPMSEDSDDSRYYESSNTCSSQPESAPTSPLHHNLASVVLIPRVVSHHRPVTYTTQLTWDGLLFYDLSK